VYFLCLLPIDQFGLSKVNFHLLYVVFNRYSLVSLNPFGNVSVLSRTVCLFPTQMFRIPILFHRDCFCRGEPILRWVHAFNLRYRASTITPSETGISCLLTHHQVSVEAVCVVSYSQARISLKIRFGSATRVEIISVIYGQQIPVTYTKNNPLRITPPISLCTVMQQSIQSVEDVVASKYDFTQTQI